MSAMRLLFCCLAGFGSGVAASMGLGGGFVLLLLLALTETLSTREGGLLNLLFFLPIAAFSLWRHQKNGLVDQRPVKPAVLGGVLGVLAGFLLAPLLPEFFFRKAFALLSLVVGLRELFTHRTS